MVEFGDMRVSDNRHVLLKDWQRKIGGLKTTLRWSSIVGHYMERAFYSFDLPTTVMILSIVRSGPEYTHVLYTFRRTGGLGQRARDVGNQAAACGVLSLKDTMSRTWIA